MNYALIENGIVTNVIWLYPGNASEFPNAFPVDGRSVEPGDTYSDGEFYRNGAIIVSSPEQIGKILYNIIGGVEDVRS